VEIMMKNQCGFDAFISLLIALAFLPLPSLATDVTPLRGGEGSSGVDDCIFVSPFRTTKPERGFLGWGDWKFTLSGRIENSCDHSRQITLDVLHGPGLFIKGAYPLTLAVDEHVDVDIIAVADGSRTGPSTISIHLWELDAPLDETINRRTAVTIPFQSESISPNGLQIIAITGWAWMLLPGIFLALGQARRIGPCLFLEGVIYAFAFVVIVSLVLHAFGFYTRPILMMSWAVLSIGIGIRYYQNILRNSRHLLSKNGIFIVGIIAWFILIILFYRPLWSVAENVSVGGDLMVHAARLQVFRSQGTEFWRTTSANDVEYYPWLFHVIESFVAEFGDLWIGDALFKSHVCWVFLTSLSMAGTYYIITGTPAGAIFGVLLSLYIRYDSVWVELLPIPAMTSHLPFFLATYFSARFFILREQDAQSIVKLSLAAALSFLHHFSTVGAVIFGGYLLLFSRELIDKRNHRRIVLRKMTFFLILWFIIISPFLLPNLARDRVGGKVNTKFDLPRTLPYHDILSSHSNYLLTSGGFLFLAVAIISARVLGDYRLFLFVFAWQMTYYLLISSNYFIFERILGHVVFHPRLFHMQSDIALLPFVGTVVLMARAAEKLLECSRQEIE